MTLTEFLLARIAEDEHRAKQAWAGGYRGSRWLSEPDRQLAECEAKRRIVAEHHPSGEYDPDSCVLCQWDIDCDSPKADYKDGAGEFPCPTLRYLGAIYADHPDYREEWVL